MFTSEAGSEGNASFAGGAEWRKQTYAGLSDPRPSLKWNFGVLIIRILLFRVLYWGPLFSETPKLCG